MISFCFQEALFTFSVGMDESSFALMIHAEICDARSKNVGFCKKIVILMLPVFVHGQIESGPAIIALWLRVMC